jgi:hypothetical protein
MTTLFEPKVKAAAKSAAQILTKDLRQYLISLGWPPQAASAVSLHYKLSSFEVEISGQYADDARLFEYGSQAMRPTAAIRKYFNRSERLQEVYFAAIEKEVGDIL